MFVVHLYYQSNQSKMKALRIKEFIGSIGSINRYSLLGRLQSDCEYFLNHGNRCEKHLWGLNVENHIWCMKVLFLTFPINLKPEWLTMNDILNYEAKMKN